MKTLLVATTLCLSALLALPPVASAAVLEAGARQEASAQPAAPAKARKSAPKRSKRYSKATLSVLDAKLAPVTTPTMPVSSAAGIALSPVVNRSAVQALPDKTSGQPSEGGLVSDALATAAAGESYDEESSLAQHERNVESTGTDGDVLGQESVSVVDRFADKPKAKAISEGPLRVKMKDSGVRASVQIPLTPALQ